MRLPPILGVSLRLHGFAWAAFALLAVGIFAVGAPGMQPLSVPFAVMLGLLVAIVLIASYGVHELVHGIVARRRGVDIDEVTLFGFVDRTAREQEPPSGGTEAIVALAGVAVSVALGLLAFAALSATGPSTDQLNELLRSALWWAGAGNLALAGINAVPAYPYDGGRALRGLIWAATGDKMRATRVAARIGRSFAWLLLFGGAMFSFVTGNLFFGGWLIVAGFFLLQTSRRQYRRLEIGRAVEGLTVEDVMDDRVATVGPNLTLDTLYDQFEREGSVESYPVTNNGLLVGSVDVGHIRSVPRGQWARTRVADVMTEIERVTTVTGRESVMDALLRFDRSRADSIPVVDESGRRLVGILTRERLLDRLGPRIQRLRDRDRSIESPS